MALNVLITGDPTELRDRLPAETSSGTKIQWHVVPVITFEKVEVDIYVFNSVTDPAPDWIVFTSPRAVVFWNALCLEMSYQLPHSVRLAAIGSRTREVAEQEGWEIDFSPLDAGSEGFLKEFAHCVNVGTKVCLPQSKKGRAAIAKSLRDLGCSVTELAIYDSVAKLPVDAVESAPEKCEWAIFTSPSSYEAFRKQFPEWTAPHLAALGDFTARRIRKDGFVPTIVPFADLNRIEEIL